MEISSIWKPTIFPWGVGMGSHMTIGQPCYYIGNFPVFWRTDIYQVIYAHQTWKWPYQSLGPNPYIPDEYVPQEYEDNPELFDFFLGEAKRKSYFGQKKLLLEMAAEYAKCAGIYIPKKPTPPKPQAKGQPEGFTFDETPVPQLNKPAPTGQPAGPPSAHATKLSLSLLYFETPGSLEPSLSLDVMLQETIG